MKEESHEIKTKKRRRSVDGVVRAKPKAPAPIEAADKLEMLEASEVSIDLPSSAPRRMHWLRRVLIIALPVLGAAVILWVVGALFLMRYSVGAVTISSRTSNASLTQQVAQATRQYRLRIVDPGGATHSFPLSDVGLQSDTAATVAALRAQQHTWSARAQWWRPVPVELAVHVDTPRLTAFISEHVTKIVEPAHDASITIKDGEVQLSDASAGKQYGLHDPSGTIMAYTRHLQPTPLRMHVVAVQPGITTQVLAGVRSEVQKVLHQHVTITASGKTTTATANDIAQWLTLSPQPAGKTVAVHVDKDKLQGYLADIAAKDSHPPHAQLSNGSATIPGEYGVTVTGAQDAANTIADQLLAAKGVQADLPATRIPFKTVSAPLTGKWIEVDLTTKRMYAYQQASVARDFLVSAGKASTPTVVGRFSIYSKFTKQTMRGADYVQPNVPWVNYFYRDFAIHGNYWSPPSYFGNVNGSHGCVGVNTTDAAWIYTWAPIGTPVIVHT